MTFQKVTLAPSIEIDWNPITDDGNIYFHLRDFILGNGQFTNYTDPNDLKFHKEKIADLCSRVINIEGLPVDPYTSEQLPSEVSGVVVMYAIKRLVDQIIEDIKVQNILNTLTFDATIEYNKVTFTIGENVSQFGDSILNIEYDWGDDSEPLNTTDLVSEHEYDVEEPTDHVITVKITTDLTGENTFTGFDVHVYPEPEEPTEPPEEPDPEPEP